MKPTNFATSLAFISFVSLSLSTACGAPPEPPGSSTGGTGNAVGTTGGTSGGEQGGGATGAGGGAGAVGAGGGAGAEKQSSACGTTPFEFVADEATNMTLASTLTFEPGHVYQGNNLELTFDWSAVTTDFFKEPFDAANETQVVMLVSWDFTAAQVADLINDDNPYLDSYANLPIVLTPQPGQTSASLRDFLTLGSSVPPEEDLADAFNPANNLTYTLILQDSTQIGVGARMIHAFTLDAASAESTIVMGDTSTHLTATATLGNPVQVPAATPDIQIDWKSSIATRSFGGTFESNGISEVIVGQYPAGIDFNATDAILALESSATALYRGQVVVDSYNTKDLKDAANTPFPGIDAVNDWYIALSCSTCSNPSPWLLTKLEACP